jgi:mannose-6-phosphate isomerase-like protein (cupin superfamily)
MTLPIVHRPGGGEGAQVGPVTFAIKAGAEETNGAYSFVEASGPVFAVPHIHHGREEAFFVLEGSVTFLAGDDTVDGESGSFLLVPRGTMHGFRCNGEARLIIMHSPAGFEEFFRRSAKAIADGTFDIDFRASLERDFELTYYDDVKF